MMEMWNQFRQVAQETGERVFRLVWDLVTVASSRIRQATEPAPGATLVDAPSPPTPAPAAIPMVRPSGASAEAAAANGRSNDQLLRVLELLEESPQPWLSAKEISDAGTTSGKPILPGNVRKVIRARGAVVIETRPREGSRRGAMEYRISDAGRRKLTEASRS